MKRNTKHILIALILTIIVAITLVACDKGGGQGQPGNPPAPPTPPAPPREPVVEVSAKYDEVTVTDTFEGYRFDKLFSVTEDGVNVLIQDRYLDKTKLPSSAGEGSVTCTYKGKSATVKVILRNTVYKVTPTVTSVTINQVQVDSGVDFSKYFSVTADDKPVEITEDMIESDVRRDVGDYTVSVTYKGASASIAVHVEEGHVIEIIDSFNSFEIAEDMLSSFDVTTLFSLYFDGEAVKVTEDMIDATALENATAGNSYVVSMRFEKGGFSNEKSVTVNVVEAAETVVTAKNTETYPNGAAIDLTSLFSITKGTEVIPVTPSMITGTIDYTTEGENPVTITYGDIQKTAVVTVRYGVIINLPRGDDIPVTIGTNKNSYDFAADFSVIVNGVKYTQIEDLIDISGIDFSKPGTTSAKITLRYNKDKIPTSGPNYETYEKTLTYVVVTNTYEIIVGKEEVILEKGTKSYDVLSNIRVKVNGKSLMPYPDREVAKNDPLAVYVESVGHIDFDSIAQQKVTLKVYVNGVDEDPVEVSYGVLIKSDIVVTAKNKVVFSDTTIYTKDLFDVTRNGESIPVTNDLISGKVDTFRTGEYTVTINYLGFVASAKVFVLDNGLVGNYKTQVTLIPEKDDGDGDDYGSGWGDDYGWGASYATASAITAYGFSVSQNGEVFLNGKAAKMEECLEDGSIILKVGTDKFTLRYENGVATLNPENSLKMTFSEVRRPFVFFRDDVWRISAHFSVNTLSQYVLADVVTGTSYDVYKIIPKTQDSGLSTKFYCMKTSLTERTSSDTSYDVAFGDCTLGTGTVVPVTGVSTTLTFGGETLDFTMNDSKSGKTIAVQETTEYANKKFSGTVDGETAELRFDRNETLSLIVKYKTVISLSKYDIAALKNGYIDHENDEVFVYDFAKDYYSYKFSLDVENGTFTVFEKDNLFGIYKNGDKYVYLDGYGTGLVNFGQGSQYDTSLSYERKGGEIDLTFLNTKPSFKYGAGATMYIDSFGNVLTAKNFVGGIENGTDFENEKIRGGALVRILYNVIGADLTGNNAKKEFYNSLEIVTKGGEIKGEEAIKAICSGTGKIIDTSTISFTRGGFYKYTVTADVFGEKVTKTFSVEVLALAHQDNKYACNFGSGILNDSVTLSIDANGRVKFVAGNTYKGLARFNENGFFAKVSGEGGTAYLSATESNGVVLVKCTGALSMNEYFVLGGNVGGITAGANGKVLRKIVYNGAETWYFSENASSIGEIATINVLNGTNVEAGAIVEINVGEKKTVARINSTNSATNGLEFSDDVRGEYTRDGADNLVIDGFGTATLGAKSAKYQINADGSASVYFADGLKVYVLADGKYSDSAIKLDATLVEGKTYTAQYSFRCENSVIAYEATTTFRFGQNGVVEVTSVSPDHDSGDFACESDTYEAVYASGAGARGTYTVSGDVVTVTVSGFTFTFTIKDVSVAGVLICSSTTVDSGAHGYFAVGTAFIN